MSALDPAVSLLFMLYVTLHMGLPLATWLMLRIQADINAHLFFASLGVYCLTIFLIIARFVLPDLLGYGLTFVLTTVSLCMSIEALRRETSSTKIPNSLYVAALLVWSCVNYEIYYSGNIKTTGIFVNTWCYLLLDILLGWQAYKIYRTFKSQNILLIVFAAIISSSGQLIKLHWFFTQTQPFDYLSYSWQSNYLLISSYMTLLFVNFGYFGFVLEKTQKLKSEAQAKERLTNWYSNELFKLNQTLQQTISEKEELLRNLTLSNKAIGMGALAGALAHELNQPLTAIGLEAQTHLMRLEQNLGIDAANVRTSLIHINNDAKRAGDIIRKLRVIFNREASGFQKLYLVNLIHDVCSLAQPEADRSGIKIHIQCDPAHVIQADPTQLHQVLLNLLTNAIHSIQQRALRHQFTGEIVVASQEQTKRIVLSVQDNGTGFPAQWRDQQLEIFKSNRPHGMGIGLWLSHKIIQLHGGQLNFTNLEPSGARVSVDLANANQLHIG